MFSIFDFCVIYFKSWPFYTLILYIIIIIKSLNGSSQPLLCQIPSSFFQLTFSLLPVFFPVYFQTTFSLLSVYFQSTSSLHPVYFQSTSSLLPVYFQFSSRLQPTSKSTFLCQIFDFLWNFYKLIRYTVWANNNDIIDYQQCTVEKTENIKQT